MLNFNGPAMGSLDGYNPFMLLLLGIASPSTIPLFSCPLFDVPLINYDISTALVQHIDCIFFSARLKLWGVISQMDCPDE